MSKQKARPTDVAAGAYVVHMGGSELCSLKAHTWKPALAGVVRRAHGVEQIVRDLENQAETMPKTAKAFEQVPVRT